MSIKPIGYSPRLKKETKTKAVNSLETALTAAEIGIGQKALDLRVLDIRQVANFSDYFLIASGTSDRHSKGIADKIVESISRIYDQDPISISGYDRSEWILVDYGDLIIHIFHEQARQFYSLDELWSEAIVVTLPQELEKEARTFRTGMY